MHPPPTTMIGQHPPPLILEPTSFSKIPTIRRIYPATMSAIVTLSSALQCWHCCGHCDFASRNDFSHPRQPVTRGSAFSGFLTSEKWELTGVAYKFVGLPSGNYTLTENATFMQWARSNIDRNNPNHRCDIWLNLLNGFASPQSKFSLQACVGNSGEERKRTTAQLEGFLCGFCCSHQWWVAYSQCQHEYKSRSYRNWTACPISWNVTSGLVAWLYGHFVFPFAYVVWKSWCTFTNHSRKVELISLMPHF